jgi:hypothetical protein
MRKFVCVCCLFSGFVFSLQSDSLVNGTTSDQCATLITQQDLESLQSISENPTDYILPQVKLSKQDLRAIEHFIEEAKNCGKKLEVHIPSIDSLLYVMDVRTTLGDPFSPTDVLMLRKFELAGSSLTNQEKISLGSCQASHLSEEDRLALHKYVDLARQKSGLAPFPLFMRIQLFQILMQNLGHGFSLEDIEILRNYTLEMMGLSIEEISTLRQLSELPSGSLMTEKEASLIEKWIRIESAFPIYALMNFEEFVSLHALIQEQSSPPLSVQSIRNDQKTFQKTLDQPVIITISSKDMQTLQRIVEHRGEYIAGSLELGSEEIQSLHAFLLAMLQFGQAPGLNATEIGQLLALIQRSSAFQDQQMLQQIVEIEGIKNGWSREQRQAFAPLIQNPQAPLSQAQVHLLKMYILKAKEVGGLNGFSLMEKALLLSIIENNTGKYFTPSDVQQFPLEKQELIEH